MRTTSTCRFAATPLVLLFGLALAAFSGCAGGEVVTPQALRAARARWDKAGVRNYDLEWSSAGPRNASFVVRVRDGQVEKVETVAPDGQRYRVKPALPKYYSVEGLFLTIAEDLAQLNQPMPFNRPKGTKAVLRFTPDPDYGYPRRYRRDVMGATAALAIDVVRFTPADVKSHEQSDNN
jgi:hypothetical protein